MYERMKWRPFAARTHLEYGAVLLGGADDRKKAAEHLDIAVAECRDMDLDLLLPRALQLQGQLKA